MTTKIKPVLRYPGAKWNLAEWIIEHFPAHTGPVVLSGYDCELYNERLSRWAKDQVKGFCDGGLDRIETVWLNDAAAAYSRQERLSL